MSGILYPGPTTAVTQSALVRDVIAVISPALLEELRGVLPRPKFNLAPGVAAGLADEIEACSELVRPIRRISVIESDPPDNRVLECAATGAVDAIVSGDRHLLGLGRFEGIEILSPSEWLKRHPAAPQRPGPRLRP